MPKVSKNFNTDAAVDLETSDKKRIRSHVLGVNYFDPETGRSVVLGTVKDSQAEVAGNHDFVPNISKITVMCNDFTVLFGGSLVVHQQGYFPLVDTLKVYANKMGGSQTVLQELKYWNSKDDPSFTGINPTKSEYAIVGNYYTSDPSIVVALEADFNSPNFTSIQRTDPNGNPSSGQQNDTLPATMFLDPVVWSLY